MATMEAECRHNWRIVGHGLQENSLLVGCPQCSTVGKVIAPSAAEVRHCEASADPYHWPNNDRVEVLQAGSRVRRVRCDDCGCPVMFLAESLSPGGITEAEGNCPGCGYQFSIMEHTRKGAGSFWENWPVKVPLQADDIERTFKGVLSQAQGQIEEAKVRAIRRATSVPTPDAEQKPGAPDPVAVPTPGTLSSVDEFLAELDKLDNE